MKVLCQGLSIATVALFFCSAIDQSAWAAQCDIKESRATPCVSPAEEAEMTSIGYFYGLAERLKTSIFAIAPDDQPFIDSLYRPVSVAPAPLALINTVPDSRARSACVDHADCADDTSSIGYLTDLADRLKSSGFKVDPVDQPFINSLASAERRTAETTR